MKKITSYLILLLFPCFAFCGHILPDKKSDSATTLPLRGFCAHRGAMETHPENTLPAFEAAVNVGAQMIELDLWLTKDKQMVVIHDNTVDRTTNGSGNIANLTLSEIKKLDAGSWKSSKFKGVQIPTFEEVLKIMPRNIWLNIHIKEDDETAVLAARTLNKENRLNQAFLACSAKAAKKAKAISPKILICNMDRQNSIDEYVTNAIASGAQFIQLKGEITSDFEQYLKQLKEKNIRINYFGTDSLEKLKLLFEYQVDFPLVNDIVNTIKVGKYFGIKPVVPEC